MIESAETKGKRRRSLRKIGKVRCGMASDGPGIFILLSEDVDRQESVYTVAYFGYSKDDLKRQYLKMRRPSIIFRPHQMKALVEGYVELKAEADRLGLKEPM